MNERFLKKSPGLFYYSFLSYFFNMRSARGINASIKIIFLIQEEVFCEIGEMKLQNDVRNLSAP